MRCKPSFPLGRKIWIIRSCCWSTETETITLQFDILLFLMLLYVFYSKNMEWLWFFPPFLSVTPFKEQTYFFSAVATPGELLCYIASPAAFYKKLYMFQVMDPSGIMKHIAHCLYTMCIHGYQLYYMHISAQSHTKFLHVCCFTNIKLLVMITGFVL